MLVFQPLTAELSAKLKHFFHSTKFSGRKIEIKRQAFFNIRKRNA